MCLGGGAPSVPKVEEPKEPPRRADEAVQRAREDEKKRAAALRGDRATILTSGAGLLSAANTQKANVLGG